MGVDTRILLPPQVEVRYVAQVIAILFGAKKRWYVHETPNTFGAGSRGSYHDTPQKTGWVDLGNSVKVKSTSVVEMADISLSNKLLSEAEPVMGDGWWLTYHFETDSGERYMSGGSRGARIALHRRLADFFGGKVDYQDCDGKEVDYRRKSPRWLGKNGNRSWREMQLALWNLKPITREEVEDCIKLSAYQK